jgi:hypothetical protein
MIFFYKVAQKKMAMGDPISAPEKNLDKAPGFLNS